MLHYPILFRLHTLIFLANTYTYLDSVINGEDVEILYGRAKKPVAKFTKIKETEKRNIGTLDGISSFSEIEDGKISIEEFLGI